MKGNETKKFALRFVTVKQKKALKKVADVKNNSLNQEINLAIDAHILNSECREESKKIYSVQGKGDL